VWIHGGAFFFGSGAEEFYDGDQIVDVGNVVVVTINYRIGALGFLALPELKAESGDHPTAGNYGFEDQQAALRWVKQNISAFGGDPGKVTIFGESAGGYSVCAHLIAPGSKGLFHRAVSESGFCSGYVSSTLEAAYPNSEALVNVLGCTDPATKLACLRGKAIGDFLHAYDETTQLPGGLFFQGTPTDGDGGVRGSNTAWRPLVDEVTIPSRITVVPPDIPKVPVLMGTNGDEGTLFSNLFGGIAVKNEAEYLAALERSFGPTEATAVVAKYPIASYPSPGAALDTVANDAFFACPARRLARDLTGAGVDVYLYVFHHKPQMALVSTLGSFHAAELAYIFGYDTLLTTTQPEEKPLGAAMRGYWTRFASTGDPNGGGAPAWPKFTAAGDDNMGFELPAPAAEANYKKDLCDFWDGLFAPDGGGGDGGTDAGADGG
jgi:para-nitrobenzyl esterase